MIDGMSAGVAYKKADQLCPSGYDIIAQQGQTSVLDYVMTVECKMQPSAIMVTPAPSTNARGATAPSAGIAAPIPQAADYTSKVISAQKLSTQMGCGDVRSTGGTTFRAQCSTYGVAIDCASDTCRPVHTTDNQ